ncbi:MAG TPA: hypothetical protein VF669_10890 [Tepidisphaeraceae bacterium]|jgi:hypothetical protein
MKRCGLLALSFLLLIAAAARAEDGAVIKKSAANVAIRTFDPKHMPKDMPKLNKNEAAVTETVFGCAVQVEVETKTINGKPVKTTVVAVRVKLSLDVTEWLPRDGSSKIKAHEDAHRSISELYYETADKAATEVAEQYIGKQLEVKDKDASGEIKRVASEVCEKYLSRIEKPSQRAQELFDEITDHGRNSIPEQRAMDKAVKQSKQEFAPKKK